MGWERFGTDNRRILTTTNQDGQMLFDNCTAWNKQEWGVDETLAAFYSCWSNTKPRRRCFKYSLSSFP
jgi:hypothetical protein